MMRHLLSLDVTQGPERRLQLEQPEDQPVPTGERLGHQTGRLERRGFRNPGPRLREAPEQRRGRDYPQENGDLAGGDWAARIDEHLDERARVVLLALDATRRLGAPQGSAR